MKKVVLSILVCVYLPVCGARGAPVQAELVMSAGRTWEGQLIRRDGDWIEFSTGTSSKPVRIGANTIKQINYSVKLDPEKLINLREARAYDDLIDQLGEVLKPFAPYSDIPSNLMRYYELLVDLYFKTGRFDDALALAVEIEQDARNPELQESGRIYQVLSLIELGRSEKAEALLEQYRWQEGLKADSAPERLYVTAKLMALKKDYNRAMELVAYIIAFNSQNTDWMQPAELFCAEVYTELGMYDSAEEVIRHIELLYAETEVHDKAKVLQARIEALRAEKTLLDT